MSTMSREDKYIAIHSAAVLIRQAVIERENDLDVGGDNFGAVINKRTVTAFSNDGAPKALFYYEFDTKLVSIPPSSTINLSFVKDTMEKIVGIIEKSKKEREMLMPEPTDVMQNIKQLQKEVWLKLGDDKGMFTFNTAGKYYAIHRGIDPETEHNLYVFNSGNAELVATFETSCGSFIPGNEIKDWTFGQAEQMLKDALADLDKHGRMNENTTVGDDAFIKKLHVLNKQIREALTSNKDGTPFAYQDQWFYISRGSDQVSSDQLIFSTRHKERLEVVFTSNVNNTIADIQPAYRHMSMTAVAGMMTAALDALTGFGLSEVLSESGKVIRGILPLQEYVVSINGALKEITKKPYRRDLLEVKRNGEVVLSMVVYPDSWSLGFNDGECQEFHNFIANRLDNTYQRTVYSKQKEVTELDIRNILKLMLDNIDSFNEASTIGVIDLDKNKITFRRDLDRDFLLFTDKFKAKYKCSGKIGIILDGVGELSYEYNTRDKFSYRAAGTHIDIGFRVMSGGEVKIRPDVPNSSDGPLTEELMQVLKQFL